MSLRKRSRTIIAILVSLFVVAALVWVATPLWFPWVLPSIAKKLNAQYSAYERGHERDFILRGVRYQDKTVLVTAERLHAPLPNRWLWALAFGSRTSRPVIQISNWTVTLPPPTKTAPAELQSTNAPVRTSTPVPQALQTIAKWLPPATLT